MPPRQRAVEEIELLRRSSNASDRSANFLEEEDPMAHSHNRSKWSRLWWPLRHARRFYTRLSGPRRTRRPCFSLLVLVTSIITILLLFTAILRPSYHSPPEHYQTLRNRCTESKDPGRGNYHNEKVFIAATLYDPQGELISGEWGDLVLNLVDLLGPNNVHLSIYENDPSSQAEEALKAFEKKLTCESSIVSEHLSMDTIPHVTIPSGENLVERIAFLAEVRNRALRPLESSSIKFDKLLFLNDVMFNPIEAANLLFSTNADASGRAQYSAACALDFINPFKFYDRFASRDLEGYTLGVPFYPFFANVGKAASRSDVLNQKDAVRVSSCWGGMTAFQAKWFQDSTPPASRAESGDVSTGLDTSQFSPLRFRYEKDIFWEASECCLIHADLDYLHGNEGAQIFMNPFVRVAYDSRTLRWLPYTKRVERLYSVAHNIVNFIASQPEPNQRRETKPGDRVVEKVWAYEQESLQGSYQDKERVATPGRFCGYRKLQVLKDNPGSDEKPWMNVRVPAGG